MSLYCLEDLPEYVEDVCSNEESRIISTAFLRVDHAITDFTSAAQWQTAIDDGKAVVIKAVRGEEVAASGNDIDGFGRENQRTVGMDQSITYEHAFVQGQTTFYNALNYASDRYVAYYTAGGKLFVATQGVANVKAARTTPSALNDIIKWEVNVSWSAQDMPDAVNGPASIFDC